MLVTSIFFYLFPHFLHFLKQISIFKSHCIFLPVNGFNSVKSIMFSFDIDLSDNL